MASYSVKVNGLKELIRAFKQVDDNLPKEMKAAFLEIAGAVASKAGAKVPVRSGKAAASIKPRSTARGASIAFGGNAAPYFPWLDFGGRVGRHKSIHREFIKEGRYIYPTIKEEGGNIRVSVDNAIKKVSQEAGF